MTWENARNQLVHILETDVSGLRTDRGLPAKLQHDEAAWEGSPGRSRTFSILSESQGTRAHDPAGARRRFRDVSISIYYYEFGGDHALLDLIVGLDYESIANELLETANWDRPNSDLISLGVSGEEILPADSPIDSTTGDRILTINFPLEHA
jgi:hypothetical protein